MGQASKVTLIPWDPNSPAHRRCLVQQREECSWHQEKVETIWKEEQIKGDKCIYWIVFPSDESHAAMKPLPDTTKESDSLQDTAVSINAVPRKPSYQYFAPIGHISLDAKNADAEKLQLDIPTKGIFWIKTFFVRHAFQGQGVGRAAMDEVETMAVEEPLRARTLMLDTVQKDDQLREDFAVATFGSIPKATNEEWYSRRGYRLIKTVQNYYGVADKNGKVWDTKTVFMRKDIS